MPITRTCARFVGRSTGVKQWVVEVYEVDENGDGIGSHETDFHKQTDLCPDAFAKLVEMIERYTSPPVKRGPRI